MIAALLQILVAVVDTQYPSAQKSATTLTATATTTATGGGNVTAKSMHIILFFLNFIF